MLDAAQHVAGRIARARLSQRPGEVHGDPGGGFHVGGGVRPLTSGQRVRARPSVEHVVAVVAGEIVAAARADEILDAAQHVSLRVSAALRPRRREVDGHPGVRVGVRRRVAALPAEQLVHPAVAVQDVVPRPAGERVRTNGPDQRVVERASDQVFDVGERVACGVTPDAERGGGAREVHLHTCPGVLVGHGVRARAPLQGVGATQTLQGVGAAAARQRVRAVRSDEMVVRGPAPDMLHAGVGVALGVAVGARALREVHDDGLRPGVVHPVGAVASDHPVRSTERLERVVPGPAVEHVGARRPRERIPVGAAHEVLHVVDVVARGVPATVPRRRAAEHHRDPCGRVHVARRVRVPIAVQGVRARSAVEDVVARSAVQDVGPFRPPDQIGAAAAGEIGVVARPPVETVRTVHPRQPVGPAASRQHVAARRPVQDVRTLRPREVRSPCLWRGQSRRQGQEGSRRPRFAPSHRIASVWFGLPCQKVKSAALRLERRTAWRMMIPPPCPVRSIRAEIRLS